MTKMTLERYLSKFLFKIVGETLYMVGIAALFSILIGLIIGTILFLTRKSKKKYSGHCYQFLSFIINVLRSFPFMILIFALIPFTRKIMLVLTGIGTSTGNTAAIVPLAIAATPFFAKIIENALIEVNEGIIEAATSLGLSTVQIVRKVILREALPSIVSGLTLSIVTLIGFSAMMCNIGAGGIGSFAYAYGYINYDNNAMLFAIITIIVLVQLIQLAGNSIYKLTK